MSKNVTLPNPLLNFQILRDQVDRGDSMFDWRVARWAASDYVDTLLLLPEDGFQIWYAKRKLKKYNIILPVAQLDTQELLYTDAQWSIPHIADMQLYIDAQ